MNDILPPDAAPPVTPAPQGYILDFISGQRVRATPEEIEGVQVFARRLVEDFGYPKELLTTRPQFRVRPRPSGGTRAQAYPVDIVVFSSPQKLEGEAVMLVECKRQTRQDGLKQLKIYLTMSEAQIGVWFNGKNHLYLLKRYKPNGTIDWVILPTLPKYGQTVGDIGLLTRDQLIVPANLKAVFKDLRNHLAGNATGVTRDQALAVEMMNLLFCKIYDELNTEPSDLPEFRVAFEEPVSKVTKRIRALFAAVKAEYDDVFDKDDKINLDSDSLGYLVGELQNYLLTAATRDAIGEAFEVFVGPAVRGEEGQFFTPRNVVQLMVKLVNPQPGERILDPACGSGGFLVVALEHIWGQLEDDAKRKRWSPTVLERRKKDVASNTVRGLDKDSYLTKLTKAYMALIGDGRGGIFCEDSLNDPTKWKTDGARSSAALGTFDVVLTNPPFGSKIKVTGTQKLAQYTLAKNWQAPSTKRADWEASTTLVREQSPQVLFIERCINFLKPDGRLGIILPESIFGMPVYGYVVKYLLENYTLKGFISLPEEVFQPSTHAKTCIVILANTRPPADYDIEMAIADWCGHDSRGNPTVRTLPDGTMVELDDLPEIAKQMSTRIQW